VVGHKDARWRAEIDYRHDDGIEVFTAQLDELSELGDIVEHGPHWDTIARIQIVKINHSTAADLTVEQSLKL
jgi:hypothetical protein